LFEAPMETSLISRVDVMAMALLQYAYTIPF
jgi:hypothetical protein